VRAIPLSPHK